MLFEPVLKSQYENRVRKLGEGAAGSEEEKDVTKTPKKIYFIIFGRENGDLGVWGTKIAVRPRKIK